MDGIDRYLDQRIKVKDIKESEKVGNKDMKSSFWPIVYTTRLEEMAIFGKDLSKMSSTYITDSIISQSKPQYMTAEPTNSVPMNTNQEYNTCEKSNQQNNDLSKHQYCQRKSEFKITFPELKSKLEEIRKISNDDVTVTKSDIEKNMKFSRVNKLESVLALYKPCEIVVDDINETIPSTDNETTMEVSTILSNSDDDDDVIVVEKESVTDITNTLETNTTSICTSTKSLTPSPVVENTNQFQNILMKNDLKDSVIIFHNLHNKELDAYFIDERYNITKCLTRYYEVDTILEKDYKLIINIIACCWKYRKCYVSILQNYKQYDAVTNFIARHLCKQHYTCNCLLVKPSLQTQDDVSQSNQTTVNDSSINDSNTILSSSSKLITMALKFKKKSKWNGYPETPKRTYDLNDIKLRTCERLLQLNNTNGEVEFYEFGRENVIYSKVVTNDINQSSWLFRTVNQCSNHLNFTFTDPADRDREIMNYRHKQNMIAFDTECFLRNPMTHIISNPKIKSNIRNNSNGEQIQFRVAHTWSLDEITNTKLKVLCISSEICETITPVHTDPPPTPPGVDNDAVTSSRPQPKSNAQQPKDKRSKSTIMEQEVSHTINFLIRDILYRFRNVSLITDEEGKITATLNAPLDSLRYSELYILTEILLHAQVEVNTLGLTSGICLNPDTPMIDLIDGCNSENQESNRIPKTVNVRNSLQIYSKTSRSKKQEYEISLCNYLNNTDVIIPKIMNVFSVNNTNCTSLDISESPLEGGNVINKLDKDLSSSTEIADNPKMLKLCVEEIKKEIEMLNNEMESVKKKQQKRKSSVKCNTKPPKIKVQTAAGIVVNNPVETLVIPRNEKIVEHDTYPSVPLTPNNVTNDNIL